MLFKKSEDHFRAFYREHENLVRGVLYNMTSETHAMDDLVQECFIKMWQGMPLFQFNSSVKTWAYRVALNTAIDHLRKQKKINQLKSQVAQILKINEAVAQVDDQRELIQKCLNEMPDEARSLVILYYFEELKLEEISKILEIPTGTVKSRLAGARQDLKMILKSKGVKQYESL